MNRVLTRIGAGLRAFARDRRANVAMMFGLALVPITVAAGVGLDYSRAALKRSQMSDALDAAALAVGASAGAQMSSANIQKAVQAYFNANYKGDTSTGTPTVSVTSYDSTKGTVTLAAASSVTTMVLKVVGIESVPIATSSTVVWGQSKLWVALVLDNSTSMNEGGKNTKMAALQSAAQSLLTKLQGAASVDGDVQVGIVPFTRVVNVGTGNASKSWLYWGYWEAPPANAGLGSGTDANGPGAACPFSDNSQGYHCQASSTNGSSKATSIPASGLICPSIDNGQVNTDHDGVYYNGCWDSTATRTKTVTTTVTQPLTVKQSCSQKGSNAESCTNNSGYPQNNGKSTTSTSTTTTNGYSGDSTTTGTAMQNVSSPSDGTKSCSGSGNSKTCTWTRTFTENQVTTTVVKTGSDFTHNWKVNDHSTWWGCVIDRPQDDDISNTAPSGTHGFPAANLELCYNSSGFNATITPLGYAWTSLSTQIGNMKPNGYTNQPIGIAHGWQMLTPGDPWGTPSVPADTSRYIILFSDGLNTQDRWYASSNSSAGDSRIDARQTKSSALGANGVCDNAKADGVIIYTLYIHLAGDPADSAPLKNCASDSTKYFNLSSTDQIATAFDTIAQQITEVRVSK